MKERRIYLVRHGETEWNAMHIMQGQLNPGLNDVGRAQAMRTALKLKETNVEVIFSSDLTRAVETANYISGQLHIPVSQISSLRERGLGKISGKTIEQIRSEYPGLKFEGLMPDADSIEGSEPLEEFRKRVASAFNYCISVHDGNIAIVTHGGSIKAILSSIDPSRDYPIVNNGNITELIDNGRIIIWKISF
ncbi:MAG: histidine phosphatase family protein [Thermoplasmataceae archaeon]